MLQSAVPDYKLIRLVFGPKVRREDIRRNTSK